MTNRAEIELLLNQTGRTLEKLPNSYPKWKCSDTIRKLPFEWPIDMPVAAGNAILHQSDVIELLVGALRDALTERDAALAKVPKWISVKERLPVKQLRVIVRTGHNMVAAGWRSYHVDVKGGELWEVDGAHNYRNDVTHWMPLPEPPKEGE